MGSIASSTGSNAMANALGIAIQMALFYTLNATITNEQSAALATLLFPWVHWIMLKTGVPSTPSEPSPLVVKGAAAATVAAICMMVLGACASGPSPKASVAAMEAALSTADTAALVYVSLPLCEAAKPPCADRSVLVDMGKARAAAFIAVMDADLAANSPRFDQSTFDAAVMSAQGALDAFQKIMAVVK